MTATSFARVAHAAPRLQVQTAKVAGRRELHFESLDDMLAEAERLCSIKPVKTLGNWHLGRALEHLARTIDLSLDGARFRASWFVRTFGPWFKNRILTQPMRPGVKLSAKGAEQLIPKDECEMHEALRHLHSAVVRSRGTTARHPSPFLGPLTIEEWNQLHLRHAEMHLSFFVPG